MSNKTVSINPNPRNKPRADASALDAFVHSGSELAPATAPKVPMKRLTLDIPAELHKRIKRTCAEREKEMVVELRRILDENFPAD